MRSTKKKLTEFFLVVPQGVCACTCTYIQDTEHVFSPDFWPDLVHLNYVSAVSIAREIISSTFYSTAVRRNTKRLTINVWCAGNTRTHRFCIVLESSTADTNDCSVAA